MTNLELDRPGVDPDDPSLTRFDLVREGARRGGIEIVHYEPRFPVPGTGEEKRVVRTLSLLFLGSGLMATAFIVAFIWWPWRYEAGSGMDKWYTPVLGLTLGLTLLFIAVALIMWAKKLFPEEVAVQERHDGGSPPDERRLTGATIVNMGDELGVRRRPVLMWSAALGLLPVAAVPVVALGGLIRSPHGHGDPLFHTGWAKGVRLVRDDGTPIRPEEVSIGGQMTVFPGIPGGVTNEYADSPTLLIHLRVADAEELRRRLPRVPLNEGSMWGNFVAYSKICTHAGCPASLYEQQTNRLLCPCHQSQFLITDNGKPIFGPASRRLPMLPIMLDDEGFLAAQSDYKAPVGPGFWERP
jgi:ubiquinol-cytochrome c reductase iron-sulfur subunit